MKHNKTKNQTQREPHKKTHRKTQKKSRTIKESDATKIARRINPVTVQMASDEFLKLKELMTCSNVKHASSRKTLGNNVVDAFTLRERLHTKGHQGISFYEFWMKRKEYMHKPYIRKMLDFYKSRKIDDIRKYKYIYNLYFSSISIFRPIVAMDVYCQVKAKRVLDFTMGWGGRLVGACALSLDAYYGIDFNKHLETPYVEMVDMLKASPGHKTEIHLAFKDALLVDYSKMDYDTVLTSPPYYDLEKYRVVKNKMFKTKEDWNETFYKPLIFKTYQHLKKGGNYCLNVPDNIYEECCKPVLGQCTKKIPLKKGERNIGGKYKEFIYIWEKN